MWNYHYENTHIFYQGFYLYVYEKEIKPPRCIYTGSFSYKY